MKGTTKVRLGLAAVALGAIGVAALPASASTGAAVISGSGTITPGLTVSGGPQTFSFDGSGQAATDSYQGAFSCHVDGDDSIGTLAQGSGGFSGTCSTTGGSEPVSGSYTRAGGVVTLNGSIGPGQVSGAFTGACTFEATNAPTVTTYSVQCVTAVH